MEFNFKFLYFFFFVNGLTHHEWFGIKWKEKKTHIKNDQRYEMSDAYCHSDFLFIFHLRIMEMNV